MSKFNYSSDICDQINELDQKLVEVITLVKSIEKRVSNLEKIAKEKGIVLNTKSVKKKNNAEDTCIIM